MLNLLGCDKESFVKVIKLMGYKKTLEFALIRKKMIIGKLKKYGFRSNQLIRTINFILDRSY